MERIVRLELDGRWFTFRVEVDGPLAFWRVEWDGRAYASPATVRGNEKPGFFRSLARSALRDANAAQ